MTQQQERKRLPAGMDAVLRKVWNHRPKQPSKREAKDEKPSPRVESIV